MPIQSRRAQYQSNKDRFAMIFNEIVQEINSIVKNSDLFGAGIYFYENNGLIVSCSSDTSYYHELEIEFSDVYFVQMKCDFRIDTSRSFFSVLGGNDSVDFNLKNRIEIGNHIFQIIDEDQNRFYIAAKSLKFREGIVKY